MAPHSNLNVPPENRNCMFCGRSIPDAGEGYYDHLRADPSCTSAWRAWRENLITDHPGGD